MEVLTFSGANIYSWLTQQMDSNFSRKAEEVTKGPLSGLQCNRQAQISESSIEYLFAGHSLGRCCGRGAGSGSAGASTLTLGPLVPTTQVRALTSHLYTTHAVHGLAIGPSHPIGEVKLIAAQLVYS